MQFWEWFYSFIVYVLKVILFVDFKNDIIIKSKIFKKCLA